MENFAQTDPHFTVSLEDSASTGITHFTCPICARNYGDEPGAYEMATRCCSQEKRRRVARINILERDLKDTQKRVNRLVDEIEALGGEVEWEEE